MAELADALDLGSSAARREGSTPFIPTIYSWSCSTTVVRCPYKA